MSAFYCACKEEPCVLLTVCPRSQKSYISKTNSASEESIQETGALRQRQADANITCYLPRIAAGHPSYNFRTEHNLITTRLQRPSIFTSQKVSRRHITYGTVAVSSTVRSNTNRHFCTNANQNGRSTSERWPVGQSPWSNNRWGLSPK
jgi:hypothetical protein